MIGNFRVWFEARPPPPPVLVPHAASVRNDAMPTHRALRNRTEVGVIASPLKSSRPGLLPRLLPGSQPGRERADGGWRTRGRPFYSSSLLLLGGRKSTW